MEILLRSPNWIGDCVMSLPAIRALKFYRPEIKITIITLAHLAAVYKNIDEIGKVIVIPRGNSWNDFRRAREIIRNSGISRGILLTNSFGTALLMRVSGVGDLTGYRNDMRGFLLAKKKKFPGKSIPQVNSYLGIIELFLGEPVRSGFPGNLVISDTERIHAENILRENGVTEKNKLIGISPAAAYGSSKEWPVVNYTGLIQKLSESVPGVKFAIFGSSGDEEKIKKITDSVRDDIFTVTSNYTLREAMMIISMCGLFIGNDSGLLHVADSLLVPSVGIFGPTSPEITAPRGERTAIFYKKAGCSPCSYRDCPIDHRCMTSIGVDEITAKSLDLLL